jgi:hypothetical protein
MSVGRKDEARLILSRYHGNGDDSAPLVVLECKEFEESIKLDASSKPWQVQGCSASTWPDATPSFRWDYVGLFRTRSDRYRTFIVLLLAFCGQWSGSGLGYMKSFNFVEADFDFCSKLFPSGFALARPHQVKFLSIFADGTFLMFSFKHAEFKITPEPGEQYHSGCRGVMRRFNSR